MLIAFLLALPAKTSSADQFAQQHSQSKTAVEQPPPIPLIIDTDLDSDCDDTGALAMAHALADRRECTLLGIIVSSRNEWSAACADAINTYYGRGDLPIGQVAAGVHQSSRYTRQIASEFPHNVTRKTAREAVSLYRELLAKADDTSTVIVSLGDLTNLRDLLISAADQYSSLGGSELVKKKVQRLVCMGSRYPADTAKPGVWGNFRTDPRSAIDVAKHWPTLIHFTGGGDFAWKCATGERMKETPETNPVRRAYEIFLGDKKTLHSADQIAVWIAVRRPAPFFTTVTEGTNVIDEYGRNVWQPAPDDPRHQYSSDYAPGVDPRDVAASINELMIQPPIKTNVPAGLPDRSNTDKGDKTQ